MKTTPERDHENLDVGGSDTREACRLSDGEGLNFGEFFTGFAAEAWSEGIVKSGGNNKLFGVGEFVDFVLLTLYVACVF